MDKRKKSWLERLDEVDAKQQAQLETHNKTYHATMRYKSHQLSKLTNIIFVSLIIVLPFIGWLVGALINPSGWASDNPSIILIVFGTSLIFCWFISIPLLIIIAALLIKHRFRQAIIFTFVISFLGSLFIFDTTAYASESEFTG